MDKKQNIKIFGMAIGGVVAAALVISLVVGIYRVYAKTGTDRFTTAVATVLRLPALKVNGKTVLYSDYISDLEAIRTIREFDKKASGPAAGLTDEQLSDQVLVRIVNNILVESAAKEHGLKVEDSDVQEIFTELTKELGSLEAAEKEIMERYGWTLKQYEKRVIRPIILQNKLAETVAGDLTARDTIRAKADKVLTEIKGGADFAAKAAEFGEDATNKTGGDLGEFRPGDMVPQFEDAVKQLKKGELAQTLVETQYGFHILRLDDARKEKTTNEAGKSVQQDVWKASHILFMYPNLNQVLGQKLKDSSIKVYVKVHNPFKDEKMQVQG